MSEDKDKIKDAEVLAGLTKKMDVLMKHVMTSSEGAAKSMRVFSSSAYEANEKFEQMVKTTFPKGNEMLLSMRDFNKDMVKDTELLTSTMKIKNKMLYEGKTMAQAELEVLYAMKVAKAEAAGASKAALKAMEMEYNVAVKNTELYEKLTKEQEKQEKLGLKIKETEDQRKKILEDINAKAQVFKDIMTDGRLAAGVFLNQMIKAKKEVMGVFNANREGGKTVSEAWSSTMKSMGDAFSFSATSMKDSKEVMSGVTEEMGSSGKATREARLEMAELAKTYGISNKEAGKLTATFANLPGASFETANNTLEFAGNLAKANGVAPGKVMKSIAADSQNIAKYSKDGGKNIASAAVAAQKLGMEMSDISSIAEGLLDFEASIEKQMEASAMLGKEINLDKARQLALEGDLAGMTKEILENVVSEAEWNQMNTLERQALAESMNMNAGQMSKMIKNQDELNNLTDEQAAGLADGSLTMDEILAGAGGTADKMWEMGKGVAGAVMGFSELKSASKEVVSTVGDIGKGLWGMVKKTMPALAGKMGGLGSKVKGVFSKKGPTKKDGSLDKRFKANKAPKPVKADKAAAASAGKKEEGGLKSTAEGLKAMGDKKVRDGIKNVALFGPAGLLATLAIPFMTAVALFGKKAGDGLIGLSKGLQGKGMGAGKVKDGNKNIALFGLAAIPALLSIPFLVAVALFGWLAGKGLMGLSEGLKGKGMGAGKVKTGIANLGLFGLAGGAAALAIPAMIAISLFGWLTGKGLIGLSKGLKKMANGEVAMGVVVVGAMALSMMALGAAAVLFAGAGAAGTALMVIALIALAAAILIMGILGTSGIGFIGVALVLALGVALLLMGFAVAIAAEGMAVLVEAFIGLFGAITMDNLLPIMMLGPALLIAGMGIIFFSGALVILAIAALFGAPALVTLAGAMFLLGLGIMLAAGGMALIASVLPSLVEGFSGLGAIGVPMLKFAGALMLMAPALFLFGAAATFALIPVGLLALAFIGIAVSMLLITGLMAPIAALAVIIAESFGAMGESIVLITSLVPAMFMLGTAVLGLAAGMTAFAFSGLLTLPTILSLIALSFVAPILIALGESINFDLGGGGKAEPKKEDNKMDTLIDEIRQLKAIASKGGTVEMDGQKVGEVIRLGLNTSGVS